MPQTYFPLRWESTGDQWWYASPIDYAAANGQYDLVRELLRLDGNHLINLTSLRRIRRLEVVWDDEKQFDDVAKNRSLVAQKLLHEGECKRGKNSLIGSGYGGWLLYTAASAGDLDFVQELLQKDPLLVFGEGEYGVTDILYAAARSKKSEVFWVVYDFALSPRFVSGTGRDLGENVGEIPSGYKFEMKNRAVHALARGGNLEMLKEILGDCSDEDVLGYRDVQCSTILHTAAARGQVEVVKDLMSSYEIINSADKQGNTALHTAAYRGQLSTVEVLIQATPSSIHSRNNAGETFLHKAVTGFLTPTFRRLDRQIDLMKQLVCSKTFKIDEIINATDNEGRTALHLAIQGNLHTDLVELLMIVGSLDVNIRDNKGMAPLDLLKQRPRSASSELLTRQLISVGATLGSQDYTARKIIASNLKMGGNGGGISPGTSFKLSDSEMFLYTGMDSTSTTSFGTPVFSMHSAELSQIDSCSNSNSNVESKSSKKNKQKGIQRFLGWIRTMKGGNEGPVLTRDLDEIPVPLRQRYSKSSSLPNNKRTLAARSNLPSPTVKKKLASGLVNGVMQAMPHMNRRSRSNSFSKSSMSSQNSLDYKHAGIDVVGASSSNQMFDDGVDEEEGVVNSRSAVNQCFCFGAPGQPTEGLSAGQQEQEIYDRYVLSKN
ncbi:ankyrin repeat-containing domain-containing protein [Artemisia annua]|uniref:Ankyrin repeat-containing domain-containing protein n=1 Tax=Artemisia annua TaxID=35608 RepID=A0A2U1LFH2_ARTAN|nr:ankyrin repeat-containing domain-containing protein [Artemisia annua]